jgi:hypothetical protein
MRLIITETRRAGKRMEEEMDVEEACIEVVLSDSGVVGEDMLDFISLSITETEKCNHCQHLFSYSL